ncbi:MAG TPA: hypothetical protein VK624_17850 [Steroidobacteraceae bacterium]|nr:hypothetical protein [Steroidobacteraceae bacterium]
MKQLVRLIWLLVHWPGALALLLASGLLIAPWEGSGPSFSDVMIAAAFLVSMGCGRILSIAGMRTLRILPDAHRLLVRALAVLTVATSLLFGGLAAWIGMRHFTAAPLTNIALLFVALSGLSFLFFARDQIRTVWWLSILAMASATALVLIAMSRLPPEFSWLTVAFCTLLWALALRSRAVPRPLFAKAADSSGSAAVFMDLRARLLLVRSPAGAILNGNHLTPERLSAAIAVTTVGALFCHVVIGFPKPIYSYAVTLSVTACFVAGLMLAQSAGMPARARHLWLRSGGARADIFRIVEKSLLANLAVLSGFSWLVMSSLTLARGLSFSGPEALLSLAGVGAGALASIYFGLLLPTLGSAWLRIPASVLATLSFVLPPPLWIRRVAADAVNGADFTSWPLALGLIATCWAVRALALNRWKTIDWTRVRPETARDRH